MTGPSTMEHHKELHERVRELEQALDEAPSRDRLRELEASRREDVDRAGRFLARAEKAERQLELQTANLESECKRRYACEARVAELDRVLQDIKKHIRLCHDSSDSNLDSFYKWKAREREAE